MTRIENSSRIAIQAALGCAMVCFASCSDADPIPENEAGDVSSRSPETAADQSEWVEFAAPDGRFRAEFPKEPDVEPGEEPNEATIQAAVGPTAYTVYYFELPEFDQSTTTPQMVLDGAREGSVANVQGQQVSHEKVTIEGQPGQAYRIEIPSQQAIGEHRILMVGKRLYSLSVVGPKSEFDDSRARKFFDSFALIERVEQP